MRICIDSCVFIHAAQREKSAERRLITLIGPTTQLVIPRLVAQEVTRNLHSTKQVRLFYRLFHGLDSAAIVDELVPVELVAKYVSLGLPEKADAYIGAFAEWMQVRYLISDNRHFLQELRTDAFEVLDAEAFIARWESDAL
jgi:hypothetical protein